MDAYAIAPSGAHLATIDSPTGARTALLDRELATTFAIAEKRVRADVAAVDAGLRFGSLDISANASAVHYAMHFLGARLDSATSCYSAEDVQRVAGALRANGFPREIGEIAGGDAARRHAEAFIKACADSELAIKISP